MGSLDSLHICEIAAVSFKSRIGIMCGIGSSPSVALLYHNNAATARKYHRLNHRLKIRVQLQLGKLSIAHSLELREGAFCQLPQLGFLRRKLAAHLDQRFD